MMTDKRMVSDWKAEAKVAVNYFEVKLTNMVCSGWLKDKTEQQEMSNASMALMEEAQCEVRKDDGHFMVIEITKDSDVKEASKREEDQRIHT